MLITLLKSLLFFHTFSINVQFLEYILIVPIKLLILLRNTEVFISELTKESSQLSNMFVESVKNIIEGESFASKVTMSINKFLNESKNEN